MFQPGPFRIIADVEYATAAWVDWYNNRRLRSPSAWSPQPSTSKPATTPVTENVKPYRSGREPAAVPLAGQLVIFP